MKATAKALREKNRWAARMGPANPRRRLINASVRQAPVTIGQRKFIQVIQVRRIMALHQDPGKAFDVHLSRPHEGNFAIPPFFLVTKSLSGFFFTANLSARQCNLSWFSCCVFGVVGARRGGGGAVFPPAVSGKCMRKSAASMATELSPHNPP
jgi:hypothetical protein